MVVKMFDSDTHFGLINMGQRVLERNSALDRKQEDAVSDTGLVVVVVVVAVATTAAVAVHIWYTPYKNTDSLRDHNLLL
jgi:hypothetical protein